MDLFTFLFKNRRMRAILVTGALAVAAPYLGLTENDAQAIGLKLSAALGSVMILAEWFAGVGPRGVLRVLGGAVASMPTLYTTLRTIAAQGGVELDDATAAQIAKDLAGLAAVLGMTETISSARRPNEGTAAMTGKLRNRNP